MDRVVAVVLEPGRRACLPPGRTKLAQPPNGAAVPPHQVVVHVLAGQSGDPRGQQSGIRGVGAVEGDALAADRGCERWAVADISWNAWSSVRMKMTLSVPARPRRARSPHSHRAPAAMATATAAAASGRRARAGMRLSADEGIKSTTIPPGVSFGPLPAAGGSGTRYSSPPIGPLNSASGGDLYSAPRGRGVIGCIGAFQAPGAGSSPVARFGLKTHHTPGRGAVW